MSTRSSPPVEKPLKSASVTEDGHKQCLFYLGTVAHIQTWADH